jgi:hypothetical protein
MKKLQGEVAKFISQFEFLKTSYKYDVILMAIYPIYLLLMILGVSFIYSFSKYSSIFFLLHIAGLVLALANNKIKGISIVSGAMCVLYLVRMFKGNVDSIIYAVIYAIIAYNCYKLFKAPVDFTDNENTASYDYATQGETSSSTEAVNLSNEQNNVQSNTQTTFTAAQSRDIFSMWQPLAAAAIIIFTFFQDWIKVQLEAFGVEATYSIANIKNLVNNFNNFVSQFGGESSELSGAVVFINIIHYSMYAVMIAEALFIIAKIIDNNKYKVLGLFGSVITIVIAVILFIIKLYVSSALKNELDIDATILTTTIFPIVAVAASVWQLIVIEHRGGCKAAGLEIVGKKCRICGTMNHEAAEQCGKCGTTLSGADIVYKL